MESNIVLIKNINTNEVLEVKLENLVPLLVTNDYIVIDYDYKNKKEIDVNLDNVADKQDVETIITTIEKNSGGGGGGSSGGLDRLSVINFLNNYFEEKTLINNVEAKASQLNKENLTNLDIENTFEILNNKLLNDLEDFRNRLVNDNLNSIVLPKLTYNVILKTPFVNFSENQLTKTKIKYDFSFKRGFLENLEVKILRDNVLYDTRIIPAGNTNYTLELIINDNGIDENYDISFEINDIISDVYTTSVLTNAAKIYGSKEYIKSVFTEATLFNKLNFYGEPIQYKTGDFDYVFKKDPLNISHTVDVYRYIKDGSMALVQNVTNILDYGLDSNVTLKLDQRGYLKLKCLNTVKNGKYFVCNEENVEGFVAIVIQDSLQSNESIINNELWATPNNICISKITSSGATTNYPINGIFNRVTNKDTEVLKLWDTSNMTNMSFLFYNIVNINANLNSWDVSNVTNMNSVFNKATSFNQPLNNWDVSKVTDMSGMFSNAKLFNNLLDNWNTSKVTNMSNMFNSASSFNQPLNSWDTSKVTNISNMFNYVTNFNQPLNNWDTSNVNNMNYVFNNATSFNQPLNNWNTSKVANMHYMFSGATSFDQPLNNWNTSNVNHMSYMFNNAKLFNQPLNNWNTSNVISMERMFNVATSFNQPLNNWNTSKVTNMSYMFNGATSFNQPLNNWCVSKISSLPTGFDTNSKIIALPVWGTCPTTP